jgi:hypothetical protein
VEGSDQRHVRLTLPDGFVDYTKVDTRERCVLLVRIEPATAALFSEAEAVASLLFSGKGKPVNLATLKTHRANVKFGYVCAGCDNVPICEVEPEGSIRLRSMKPHCDICEILDRDAYNTQAVAWVECHQRHCLHPDHDRINNAHVFYLPEQAAELATAIGNCLLMETTE